MGRHSAKRNYTVTEWVIGVSALVTFASLPILLVTVIIAQIVILSK